jgi:hypothetical protein
MSIVDAIDNLSLQPLFDMSARWVQARNAVDYVNRQVAAIDLVEDGEFERCVDAAFFFISTHVNVVVILTALGKLVDERGIGMEVEDYRLIRGEKRVEVAVGKSVRVFALRH